MADDAWKLEAISEQFNVLDTITTNRQNISSTDYQMLLVSVAKIINSHMKMQTNNTKSEKVIAEEIMKHCDGDEIKLSFVVIVMNIRINGRLSKMPIFVIISGERKKFIDVNLSVFNSWDTFLKKNDLPSCQFCFPVSGHYDSRRTLKIDFASSPASLSTKLNISFVKKWLGIIVAVGSVAASYFFEISPTRHKQIESLWEIAENFVSGVNKYRHHLMNVVNLVQRLRNGHTNIIDFLPAVWRLLNEINDDFGESISSVLLNVRATLIKTYNFIKSKLSYFFENASNIAKHTFMAVTSRLDTEIITVDSQAEELLQASRNRQTVAVDAAVIHDQVDIENGYVNSIFKNAKTESGIKSKSNENFHPVTSNLLDISNSLAEKLGKKTLKDVQDIYEALNESIKEEFQNNIKNYTKSLTAAEAGAGHKIDVDEFNQCLGIKGDVKGHFWMKAMETTMSSRIAYFIDWRLLKLKKERKVLILELYKKSVDDISGLYRCIGVNGDGYFHANNLMKALKDIQVEFNEEILVINETSSMISIRSENLVITAMQKLNIENTSEGMVYIDRIEVY